MVQFITVGIIGIVLYLFILGGSIYLFINGMKSNSSVMKQIFFTMLMVMSIMEMPRYFNLAIDDSYTSQSAYCCHIISGIFFFAAFSILCHQWCTLLQAGDSFIFAVVYGKYGLLISNIGFAIDDVVTISICMQYESLDDFFHSNDFYVFTLVEGVRNILYSSFLSYYGIMLVRRLWRLNTIQRQASLAARGSYNNDVESGFWFINFWKYASKLTEDTPENVFALKVFRVTAVLTLCSVCFIIRVSMLVVKLVTLDYNTVPTFSLFGILWFTLADFIPRVIPSIALMKIASNTNTSNNNEGESNNNSSSNYEQTHVDLEMKNRNVPQLMNETESVVDGIDTQENSFMSEEEEDLSSMFKKYARNNTRGKILKTKDLSKTSSIVEQKRNSLDETVSLNPETVSQLHNNNNNV
mmetsp:Transcript_28039/g.39924  ORF Transcript_28039/g.39924 Transcript_28039/m.39924 type:complete len:411 (-) Transcript_28039:112-1344(-)